MDKSRQTMLANEPQMFGDYPHLLAEIKERIRSAQYEALKKVNKELVILQRCKDPPGLWHWMMAGESQASFKNSLNPENWNKIKEVSWMLIK